MAESFIIPSPDAPPSSSSSIAERRKLARQMLAKAMASGPIQSPWQGVANMVNAGFAGWEEGRLDAEERKSREGAGTDAAAMRSAGLPDAASAASPSTLATPGTPDAATGSALPASLNSTESGGRWNAQNDEVGAGGAVGHFGRAQFGQARLQEAANAGAIPQGTTPQQFMKSPELQKSAENWHFADIDQNIRANGFDKMLGQSINGVPITMGGMRAVAHLGGNKGLQRFIQTGGRYNPSDANGTSLMDYFTRHGTGMRTAQADMPAPEASTVEMNAGQDGFFVPPGEQDPNTLRSRARELQMTDWAGAKRLMDRAAELEAAPRSVPGVPFAANEADVQRLEAEMQPKVDAQAAAAGSGNAPGPVAAHSFAPAFTAEGTAQPWMGSALGDASPSVAAVAKAMAGTPMPPRRPANLAMDPRADQPAPGAAQAVGQTPPAYPLANTADPTADNGGILSGLVASEELRKGLPSGASITNPIQGLVALLSGRPGGVTGSPATPGQQQVAKAMMSTPEHLKASAAANVPGVSPEPGGPATTGAIKRGTEMAQAAGAATPSPQQVAFGTMAGGQNNAQLSAARRVLNNPYASAGDKLEAKAILERSFKGAEYENVTRPDGSVWRVPKGGGGTAVQVFGAQTKPEGPTGDMREYELYRSQEREAGRQPGSFTDWSRANRAASKPEVNIDTKGGTKFAEKANEYQAKRYFDMATSADEAVVLRSDVETLSGLLSGIQTGRGTEARLGLAQMAKSVGLDAVADKLTGGKMDEMEAALSIMDKLTPRMRVPGSGATSDMEMRTFRNALPSLLKQPGGNALVTDTYRGMLDYQAAAGDLARQALRGEISQADADKGIKELPSPFARFKEYQKAQKESGGGAGAAGTESKPAAAAAGPAKIGSRAEYDALPSGSRFIDPEGNPRIKP